MDYNSLRRKATIHQLTTMLGTSKMSYFQVITTWYYQYWWPDTGTRAIIKVKGHQYQWLADGYDLTIGHF